MRVTARMLEAAGFEKVDGGWYWRADVDGDYPISFHEAVEIYKQENAG